MRIFKLARDCAILLFALSVAGCGGGSSSASTGTLSVSLMDRPVDGVTELYVTISEVWIKPQGGGPAEQVPMTSTPLTVSVYCVPETSRSLLSNTVF